MSSEHNRREPRLRIQVPVILTMGKKIVTTSTEDISYRGLYVPLDDDLPKIRALVKVEIQLRGGAETFAPHAMVVRHGNDYGKQGVGLEFFGRTESIAWDQFVREAQQQPQQPSYPSSPPPMQSPPMQSPPMQSPPMQGPPHGFGPPPQPPAFSPPPPPFPGPPPANFAPPPVYSPPPHTPFAQPAPVIHGFQSAPSFEQPPNIQPPVYAPPERQSAPPPAPAAPSPFTGSDRRRHARFALPIEIRVRTQRAMHIAYGIDASLGGLSLCGTDLALTIGEQVILNLAQPGTPMSFRVEVIVRRTVPAPHAGMFGYGVEFTNLDPPRTAMLQEFLDTARAALGQR